MHTEIGVWLAEAFDLVLLIDNPATRAIQKGLADAGYPKDRIAVYPNTLAAHADLGTVLRKNDTIVFQNDWTDNYFSAIVLTSSVTPAFTSSGVFVFHKKFSLAACNVSKYCSNAQKLFCINSASILRFISTTKSTCSSSSTSSLNACSNCDRNSCRI